MTSQDKLNQIKDFVSDVIKPYYFENIVAWVLNNCEVKSREDVPCILGDRMNATQRALEDYILAVLGVENA